MYAFWISIIVAVVGAIIYAIYQGVTGKPVAPPAKKRKNGVTARDIFIMNRYPDDELYKISVLQKLLDEENEVEEYEEVEEDEE